MDPASARCVIRIKGHLGATMLSAFPPLASHLHGAETVLTGFQGRVTRTSVTATVPWPPGQPARGALPDRV